jgi:hypothetical protein
VPLTISPDDALKYVLQLVGIVAPVIALITYRRNMKTKRAEWLSTLHAKFFESTNYKSMRHILDYEPAHFVPQFLRVHRKPLEAEATQPRGGGDDVQVLLDQPRIAPVHQ